MAKVLEAEAQIALAFPDLIASVTTLEDALAAVRQHQLQGQSADALAVLQVAASAYPLRFEPDAWTGDIHMSAGETEAARDAYAASAGRPAAPADIHAMLGICYALLGEVKAGIAAMRQVVAMAGNNMIYTRWLATLLVQCGQHEDAEPLLRELLRRYPEKTVVGAQPPS